MVYENYIEKKIKISGQKFKIQFDITLQKFNHFYELTKKIPSETSKNIDEKKLGSWFRNNVHYYRNNETYNYKNEFQNLLTYLNYVV